MTTPALPVHVFETKAASVLTLNQPSSGRFHCITRLGFAGWVGTFSEASSFNNQSCVVDLCLCDQSCVVDGHRSRVGGAGVGALSGAFGKAGSVLLHRIGESIETLPNAFVAHGFHA